MNRMVRTVAMAVCFIGLASGCGLFFSSDENPLEAELSTVKDGTQAVPLRDLTDFAWDEVHLFNEYTAGEFINKTVGSPVVGSDYHSSGSLLVFEDKGAVVNEVTVTGDYIRATGSTFGSNVLAVPNGSGALRLENPPS